VGLQLNLLGGFDLRDGAGLPIGPSAKKARALLAYLALSGGRPQSRDKLAALLWDSSDETQARTSLRQSLTALRKSLGADLASYLKADTDTVTLTPGGIAVDAVEFEQMTAVTGNLEPAVACYGGDLLDGFHVKASPFEDWLRVERQRLRDLALDTMATLLEYQTESDEIGPAIDTAGRLIRLDPLQENIHRALMGLYANQGRDALALKQYRACRAVLQKELGVSPDPQTEKLYRRILQARRTHAASNQEDDWPDPQEPAPQSQPAPQTIAELRQATILFSGIADFTVIGGTIEPEEIGALLNEYFDVVDGIIEKHGGIVAKHVGDTVMAVFGVSVAHGNEPERALRAATEIHGAMPGIECVSGAEVKAQIGAASGQILASEIGSERHHEHTVTGQAVNLSAYLSAQSEGGETRVSDALYRSLGEKIEFEPLTEPGLDVTEELNRTWRVKPGQNASRAASSIPLIGRKWETQQLSNMLDSCVASGRGQAILIRGEAGIGKTKIIEELNDIARGKGFESRKTLILDFGMASAEDAVRTFALNMARFDADTDLAVVAQWVDRLIEKGFVGEVERMFVNSLLGLAQPPHLESVFDSLDNDTRTEGRRRVVRNFIISSAGVRPSLAIVEDIHWADETIRADLANIAMAVAECPAALVMTTRVQGDPIDPAWRAGTNGCPLITLDLGPLGEVEAHELAALHDIEDESFVTACVGRAGGHPLFLDQLLRGGPAAGGNLPGTVQSIVLTRTDRLAAADRSALHAAAVLGQRFSLEAVRLLVKDPDYDFTGLIDEVLVRPEGGEFLFTHALIRDAVYASLLKSERCQLHIQAADWYARRDIGLSAHHLDYAGEPSAAHAYLGATSEQASRYQFASAIKNADRGLEIGGAPQLMFDLACARGEALTELGEIENAVSSFDRALTEGGKDANPYRAHIGIASCMRVLDRYQDALQALDAAEAAAGQGAPASQLAQLWSMRGNIYFPLGDIDACLTAQQKSLHYAQGAKSASSEVRALGGLADAYYQRGQMITAFEYYDRCVTLAREQGFKRIETANLAMRGLTKFYSIEFQDLFDDCRQAIDICDQFGDARGAAIARVNLSMLGLYRADWKTALEEAELGISLAMQIGARRFESDCMCYKAEALAALGDRNQAEQVVDAVYQINLEMGLSYCGPIILGLMAMIVDDTEKRLWALSEGERLLTGDCVSHNYLMFYRFGIEAALSEGNWDLAARYADALEVYTKAESLPWSDYFIAWGRALSEHGRGQRGSDLLEQLRSLKKKAEGFGMTVVVPRIEAALDA
jgi:DNA-binding SARP family transcriptional activator/class 3 adenylate cyclase/tetratricopeptide (TPR) repeat protein